MGRKKGFDEKKILGIIRVLLSNPDGVWLRQLAKETQLSPATVSKYLDTALKPLVEENSLGSAEKPLLRVIKLRPFVFERLQEGKSLADIMKILRLLSKIS
jgi:predicted DNA-binding transcriptional regulator YafY